MFKLSAKLIEENDKIKEWNLDLKDYVESFEKSNEVLKYEMANLKNWANICEKCVSMKKEVKELHDALSIFTKGNKILTWFYQVKCL